MLLFDTCTLLWLVFGDKKLNAQAKTTIRKYKYLFVSSISLFEIAIKYRKKLLILPQEPISWFELVRENHGIEEIPVDAKIFVRATGLPDHHKDPCDRIIVATAQIHNMMVLTPDKLIKQYDVSVAWSRR